MIITGGNGMTERDHIPEAMIPLLDEGIDGFGGLFRSILFQEIGSSTIQSRVLGGIANGTFIFAIPGSTNACQVAWDAILNPQLDSRTKPCNFVQLFARLKRD